ncbi:MAG TPA: ribosome assembly RNA-binding protein YhbY [Ruminococcaceae bacterium]|nr:ribosome assembly RNA-binding protein YhbY [Oscillospiraceae bacterium]
MINSKQRAMLRALANPIETIFQVGKGGIGGQLLTQVDEALEKRELIKLRVLESSGITAKDAAQEIANGVSAEVVQVIGSRFVLFRESANEKNRQIRLK